MLFVAGCSGDLPATPAAARPLGPAGGSAGAPATRCAYTSVGAGDGITEVGKPAATTVPAPGATTLTIAFGQGTVTARLDPSRAPCTVNSIAYLAGRHCFDNTVCHRVTDSILQCGDPSGTGSGGPAYRFRNEDLPRPVGAAGTAIYLAGTVGMANSAEPDRNSSQFFLVFKDVEYPADYPIFGRVVGGLDTLQQIGAAGNDGSNPGGGGKPSKEVKISSLTVASG
jgi:peptidyl-prolyl cis-trans isomerase B (cyclophilin B)